MRAVLASVAALSGAASLVVAAHYATVELRKTRRPFKPIILHVALIGTGHAVIAGVAVYSVAWRASRPPLAVTVPASLGFALVFVALALIGLGIRRLGTLPERNPAARERRRSPRADEADAADAERRTRARRQLPDRRKDAGGKTRGGGP